MTMGAVIDRARRDFFEDGRLPEQVRQPVLRSWIRCSDLGLSTRSAPAIGPIVEAELRALQQRHETFMRLCRPELETLNVEARDTGSVAILTDDAGMILDAIGDAGFATRAAQVLLRPGVSWSEAITGTNAIGVALAERRPAAVDGSEHFFAGHTILSCAATPVMDPRGAVLGVLDLSGSSALGHGHALGLVRMAVDQIEHRLFGQRFEGCRLLRFHRDPAMLGTSREGILVFREDRLIGGNRRALSLIGGNWDLLDTAMFEEIFDRPALEGRPYVSLQAIKGGRFVGRWSSGGNQGPALSMATFDTEPRTPGSKLLADVTAGMIDAALAASGGNVTKAARVLGVHRSTVHRHLHRTSMLQFLLDRDCKRSS